MTTTRLFPWLFASAALAFSTGCSTTAADNSRASASNVTTAGASRVDATQVDKNGDRLISKEEAAALPGLAKEFEKIDANRDGLLDQAEVGAYHHGMMGDHHANLEARFQQADTDRDGALTMEEAKAGRVIPVVHHFAQLDGNKDGKVSLEEVKSARMQHGNHGGQCGGHMSKHGEGHSKGGMSCGHGEPPVRQGTSSRSL